jgi:hypothetical protein
MDIDIEQEIARHFPQLGPKFTPHEVLLASHRISAAAWRKVPEPVRIWVNMASLAFNAKRPLPAFTDPLPESAEQVQASRKECLDMLLAAIGDEDVIDFQDRIFNKTITPREAALVGYIVCSLLDDLKEGK